MLRKFYDRILNRFLETPKTKKSQRALKVAIYTAILFPLVLMALFSYKKIDQQLTQAVFQKRQSIASLAATVVKDNFDNLKTLGTSLTSRFYFRQMLQENNWERALELIKPVLLELHEIDHILLIDPQGNFKAGSPLKKIPPRSNYASFLWYQLVAKNHEFYLSDVYQNPEDSLSPRLVLAIPILSKDRELLGILAMEIRVETLLKWIEKIREQITGFVYLVNTQGQIVSHPNIPGPLQLTDFSSVPAVQKIMAGQSGVMIQYNPIENENRVVAFEYIADYKLGVISQQPKNEAFTMKNRTLRLTLSFYAILFFLTGGLAHFLIYTLETIDAHRIRERTLLESVGDGIMAIHKNGNVFMINRSGESMTGWPRNEILGNNYKDFIQFRDETSKTPSSFIKQAIDSKNVHFLTGTALLVGKDGQAIPVWGSASPLFDTTGKVSGTIISFYDVSFYKKTEEKLKRIHDELEERVQLRTAALEKTTEELKRSNEELDDFAYIVSHDLKEPIRGISQYAHFIKEDYKDRLDDQGKQMLDNLTNLPKQMELLIDSLLNYSRVGRLDLNLTRCDLNQIVKDVCCMLDPFIKENNAILVISNQLPPTYCDAVRIREVFQNLITNAIKYNNQPQKKVEIGYKQPEGDFYVKDNGIGVSLEYHEKIFKMFKRLHTRNAYGGGTGAGLTIVKKIIQRHGGKIWVESEPGQGSTFYFTLPA